MLYFDAHIHLNVLIKLNLW